MPTYPRRGQLLFFSLLGVTGVAHADADVASGAVTAQRESAGAELAQGGHRGVDLAPLYRELATQLALKGDTEGARKAFVALLAVDPTFRLARTEADEIRAPYLEARGFWQSFAKPLNVDVRLDPAGSGLLVSVTDPANLSVRIKLRARTSAMPRAIERVVPTAATLTLPLDGASPHTRIEYSVALLDEHGNRLYELGNATDPQWIEPAPDLDAAARQPEHAVAIQRSGRGHPLIAGISFGVAVGAVTGAIVAHVKRETLADDWNRASCSGSGDTRAQRCSDEHTRIQRMNRVAGSLYGVGAASLVTGLITLLVPRRDRADESGPAKTASFHCSGGPGEWGLLCRTAF